MPKKILVVDDDRKIRELQKVLFIKSGFSVLTASDGTEALDVALKEIPDIVILDIEMPGKDGFATLVELRSHKELKNIPVIMLSALSDDVYHRISESMGTVEHLDKPFDPRKLLDRVRDITG